MAINAISSTPLPLARPQSLPSRETSTADASFGDALTGLLGAVDQAAGDANTSIANMVRGTGDVHEAMIALHHAETSLQLTVQVRNKLVQAYQDIMRMPI